MTHLVFTAGGGLLALTPGPWQSLPAGTRAGVRRILADSPGGTRLDIRPVAEAVEYTPAGRGCVVSVCDGPTPADRVVTAVLLAGLTDAGSPGLVVPELPAERPLAVYLLAPLVERRPDLSRLVDAAAVLIYAHHVEATR
jgi:hypothetical protein